MTQADGFSVPLLDPDVVQKLREELDDDEGLWKVFAQTFINLLPQRIDRLRLTLSTGDLDGAMDAVISLRTSSQMIGAQRLAGMAESVEKSLRSEPARADPARALPLLAAAELKGISNCAWQTTGILEWHLK